MEENKHDLMYKVRNILNTIFILLALAGMATYFFADKTIGMYIVLTAMVIKFVESAIRMTNR